MRKFTTTEQALLQYLVVIANKGPLAINKFLARVYFSEADGRALILQPAGHFGYLYLRPDRFADESSREAELKALIESMMLLAWLRGEGYIMVDGAPASIEKAMRFVGEIFGDIRPSATHIVLNDRGDYTADPKVILNRDEQIIYEGVRLEGDLFELAMRMSNGLMHVSMSVEDLLHPQTVALAETSPAPHEAAGDATAKAPASPPALPPAVPPAMPPAMPPQGAEATGQRSSPAEPHEELKARKEVAGLTAAADPRRRHLRVIALVLLALAVLLGVIAWRQSEPLKLLLDPLTAKRAPASPSNPTPAIGATTPPAAPPPVAATTPSTQGSASPSPDSEIKLYRGIDLSKWNGNWLEHLQGSLAGISFAFVRATYGRTKDPSFDRHWTALQEHGIIRGSYHFYLVHEDPLEQMRRYLNVISKLGPQDIAPAIDFEELSFPPSAIRLPLPERARVQADLLAALAVLEQETGRIPLIYTDVSTGNQWLDDQRFARFPLWIADWTELDAPKLPAAWKNKGFRFWQRAANYTLPPSGNQALDLDLFRGRIEDINR